MQKKSTIKVTEKSPRYNLPVHHPLQEELEQRAEKCLAREKSSATPEDLIQRRPLSGHTWSWLILTSVDV